jgi:hypothetical protein
MGFAAPIHGFPSSVIPVDTVAFVTGRDKFQYLGRKKYRIRKESRRPV